MSKTLTTQNNPLAKSAEVAVQVDGLNTVFNQPQTEPWEVNLKENERRLKEMVEGAAKLTEADIAERLKSARAHYEKDNFEEALKDLQWVEKLDPKRDGLNRDIARNYVGMGDDYLAKAKEYYGKEPEKDTQTYKEMMRVSARLGDLNNVAVLLALMVQGLIYYQFNKQQKKIVEHLNRIMTQQGQLGVQEELLEDQREDLVAQQEEIEELRKQVAGEEAPVQNQEELQKLQVQVQNQQALIQRLTKQLTAKPFREKREYVPAIQAFAQNILSYTFDFENLSEAEKKALLAIDAERLDSLCKRILETRQEKLTTKNDLDIAVKTVFRSMGEKFEIENPNHFSLSEEDRESSVEEYEKKYSAEISEREEHNRQEYIDAWLVGITGEAEKESLRLMMLTFLANVLGNKEVIEATTPEGQLRFQNYIYGQMLTGDVRHAFNPNRLFESHDIFDETAHKIVKKSHEQVIEEDRARLRSEIKPASALQVIQPRDQNRVV